MGRAKTRRLWGKTRWDLDQVGPRSWRADDLLETGESPCLDWIWGWGWGVMEDSQFPALQC